MDLLQSDVLLFSNFTNLQDRLKVNKSVSRVYSLNNKPTVGEIYFPNKIWTEIDDNQFKSLIPTAKSVYLPGRDIQLFSIPQKLKEIIKKYNLDKINDSCDLEKFKLTDECTEILKIIDDFTFKNYLIKTDNFYRVGVFTGLPNLESVSFYDNENTYVGMHVDNWDLLSIKNRLNSRNLFCINLGKEPRHFIYCNLSLLNIVKTLYKSNYQEIIDTLEPDEVVLNFLKNYPNYPLYRFTMYPFDCYIAPIQNIIHEGSTLNSKELDLYYMSLGYL